MKLFSMKKMTLFFGFALIIVSCTSNKVEELELENMELKATVEKLRQELDSVITIVEYQIEQAEQALKFARKEMIETMRRAGESEKEIQEVINALDN